MNQIILSNKFQKAFMSFSQKKKKKNVNFVSKSAHIFHVHLSSIDTLSNP